jgi:hypothetical protein
MFAAILIPFNITRRQQMLGKLTYQNILKFQRVFRGFLGVKETILKKVNLMEEWLR